MGGGGGGHIFSFFLEFLQNLTSTSLLNSRYNKLFQVNQAPWGGGCVSKSSGHGNNCWFRIEKNCDIRDALERIGVISLRTARKIEGDDKYKKSLKLYENSPRKTGGGGGKYYQKSETFQNLMEDISINIQVFGRITRTIPDAYPTHTPEHHLEENVTRQYFTVTRP